MANINVGYEQYAEGAGSNASVVEFDSSGSGLVVDSEENMEVGLNCQVSPNNNSVVADSQPVESSGGISQCDINSPQSATPGVANNPVGGDNLDLVIPGCNELSSTESLMQDVNDDDTLDAIRDLANRKLNGYSYNNKGVLIHSVVDEVNNVCNRIVLPMSKRNKALVLAHDNTAHVGVRGMRRLLGTRFVWPGIHGDIVKFVKSCDVCLRVNRSGNRKALMVQRPVLTQPFESVAVDLVGPLPKGKRA